MKNAIAFVAGVLTYWVFGTIFGLMSLGVGFMPEPNRTRYSYIILLMPFVSAGLAVGYLARSHALVLAAALAVLALGISGMLAGVDWFAAAQATYQGVLCLFLCVLSSWMGAKFRFARARRWRA